MSSRTIVLDTNVLVAGLLNPHGAPGRLVDLLVDGELRIAYDDRILSEYRQVLARPRFGFDLRDVQELLETLTRGGLPVIASPVGAELPDPDDLPFLEVANAARAEALVTGNLRHFPLSGLTGDLRIEAPATFLRKLRS